ncbi:MAG: c-type cytochrome [Gemmataceae bacterium]|nr:c-type cytochrome [Gemmataceae bacterium]
MRNFLLTTFLASIFPLALSAQGLTPQQAMARMKVPEGMEVRLVAAEPEVRQPLSIFFDEKGRMWVLQYLQYPNPAGLKAVKQDQFLRTIWDKFPEPPPKGPKGKDLVTIHFDPDEKGRFRKSKEFVSGLNLASGMVWGHGGLFVAQPPYLLFYPDKNGDDVPDSDPEVLLSGFGMEDSHAYANSLQWGPDGWLYGAQGSTVTARIRGLEFQQGIWRFHPKTKVFELFSEGGGNTWGLDFDRTGQIIAGTNYGNFAMLHQVQGAYYVKGFAKHGPLHNPHTYGYFEHMPFKDFKGGHVTNGGIVYQAGLYPPAFRNRYIAGNLLSNTVYFHDMEAQGSSFAGKFGGDFLIANDPWFRPVDCFQGPEGAVHVVDWHDKRAAHLDPVDNWDRTNGRIYKVVPKGFKEIPPFDLKQKSSRDLLLLLDHENAWFSREARRLLAERKDLAVVPLLMEEASKGQGRKAWESLWALAGMGQTDPAFLVSLFDHSDPVIREWSVRLLLDLGESPITNRLLQLAALETNARVVSQIASSVRRVKQENPLPVIHELLKKDQFALDPHISLLLWWAIEDRALVSRGRIMEWFSEPEFWKLAMVRNTLLARISRRWASEGSQTDWEACAKLLQFSPGSTERNLVLEGIDKALEGRRLAAVPIPLETFLKKALKENPNDRLLLRLAIRLGDADTRKKMLELAQGEKSPDEARVFAIRLIAEQASPEDHTLLSTAFSKGKNSGAVQAALLEGLLSSNDPKAAQAILSPAGPYAQGIETKVISFLSAKPAFAHFLLKEVGKKFPKEKIPIDLVRQMASYPAEEIQTLITKNWGKVSPPSPGEKLARISYVNLVINRHKADIAMGKVHFQKHCASCHTLFGEGTKLGPDLTTADRQALIPLVTQVVDPSAHVRPEYVSQVVETKDGRLLTGLLVEENQNSLTLVDAKNQKITLAKSKVESISSSPKSIMPDGILDILTDQDIADLFAYVRSQGPPQPLKPR